MSDPERDAYRRATGLLVDMVERLVEGVSPTEADWQQADQALAVAAAFGTAHA